jgi:hypothetical protein
MWTTKDVFFATHGLYQYANGSPTLFVDPSGSVSVTVNAFIHRDQDYSAREVWVCPGKNSKGWIPAPINLSNLAFYRGDSRDFILGEPAGKTSRAFTTIQVPDCSVGNLTTSDVRILRAGANRTQGLKPVHYGGKLRHVIKCYDYHNPIPDFSFTLERVTNVYQSNDYGCSEIVYRFQARDPLVWLSPHLNAWVTVTLCMKYCTGVLRVIGNARHTRYPWFEAYASSGTERKWLFKYEATVDDIFFGLQFTEESQGAAIFNLAPCSSCCS